MPYMSEENPPTEQPLPSFMEDRRIQFMKHPNPIIEMLSPIVSDVISIKLKALSFIVFIPVGMLTDVTL